MPTLRFEPVTAADHAGFEALFDAPGGPKSCWCMVWRATAVERQESRGAPRRRQMLGRIDAGVPVGLIGFDGDEPVAWVSVAPRDTYRPLGAPAATAGERVWSLVCMYVTRRLRGEGIGDQLISAAAGHAAARGATVLEAYPVEPDAPSYRFMGFVPAFERAGFVEVGRAGARRHVMRLTLSTPSAGKP
jgi:GNAT superfamily N-acetyltransferase